MRLSARSSRAPEARARFEIKAAFRIFMYPVATISNITNRARRISSTIQPRPSGMNRVPHPSQAIRFVSREPIKRLKTIGSDSGLKIFGCVYKYKLDADSRKLRGFIKLRALVL